MAANLSYDFKQAVLIAWNPGLPPSEKAQAIDFLNRFRSDPTCWNVCLRLFVELSGVDPGGTENQVIRHFCLESIIAVCRQQAIPSQELEAVKDGLLSYVYNTYSLAGIAAGSTIDTPHIQNKLSEAFTSLFTHLYLTSFPDFFHQFRKLASGSSPAEFNPTGALFFIRLLISIHDEIADVLISRPSSVVGLHSRLKDQIRERDISSVIDIWSTVLGQWEQLSVELTDTCLKSIGRWVQWIDLSLVVKNSQIMSALCTIVNPNFLSPESEPESPLITNRTRLLYTAVDAFSGIVSKKCSGDKKIELIHAVDLSNLIALLVRSRQLAEFQYSEHYDNDLAEIVAKLVNLVVSDLVLIADSKTADSTSGPVLEASRSLLADYLPFVLRFLSDEYDNVCHSVLGAATSLVTWYRHVAEKSSVSAVEPQLLSLLEAIVAKLQFHSSIEEEDDIETSEEAFLDVRKKLSIVQKMIADIDRGLVIQRVTRLIDDRFELLRTQNAEFSWHDLELGMYELSQFSEIYPRIGYAGPDGQRQPLADEVMKRIASMIEIGASTYPNSLTQILYLEICTKFLTFFDLYPTLIQPALEAFIRLSYSESSKVRHKAWSSLSRFVTAHSSSGGSSGGNGSNYLRPIAKPVMMNLENLLAIKSDGPVQFLDETGPDEDGLLDDEFRAQLHVFEAVGVLLSLLKSDAADFITTTRAILSVFCSSILSHLAPAKAGGVKEVTVVHHNIMALAIIAHKLGTTQASQHNIELAQSFEQPNEVILNALLSLNNNKSIRIASRFALTRLVEVMGESMAPHLHPWFSGLLCQENSNAEMAQFLPLLNQTIYVLNKKIESVLADRITLVVSQVLGRLNQQAVGTDDRIQLQGLQREFFSFLLYVLSHEMGSIFTTEANNPTFQSIVLYLQTVAKGESPHGGIGQSLKVINKIVSVYGGPGDAVPDNELAQLGISQPECVTKVLAAKAANAVTGTAEAPSPQMIPHFVELVMDIVQPLIWLVPTGPAFKAQDSDGKETVKEILILQVALSQKGGAMFLKRLSGDLGSIPAFGSDGVVEYLTKLYHTSLHRLASAPATKESFLFGYVGSATATPFGADSIVKELKKYYEGVVAHIRGQKGL